MMSNVVYNYRPCKCSICKKPFTSINDGKRHVVLTHGKTFSKAREFIELIIGGK